MDIKNNCLFLLLLVTTVFSEYVSYKDYRVYNVEVKSKVDVEKLQKLQEQNKYNFWTDVIKVENEARIMVDPDQQATFETYMKSEGLNLKISIPDVQQMIDAQMNPPAKLNRNSDSFGWTYYHTLEDIYNWLDEIQERYPSIVTLVTIGRTFEGRDIKGIKIDYKKRQNPVIGMIEGGIHAREWISPATVTWIINEFLTSTDDDIKSLAENVVWHIFPVINPDGYVYTFTNNRMWRKNRHTANFVNCTNVANDLSNGIDLNRNFGYVWMSTGASQNPCDETYAGPAAFSELESMAIGNYAVSLEREGRFIFYYAFHSYSQMVLVPFSHVGGSNVLAASNYGDMFEIAIRGQEKLKERYGTEYLVGTSADILYEVSGSSFDWVKGVLNVPVVYLFELRDIFQFGFLLPAEQIIPNNQEIMDALVEMDKVTRKLGYYQNSAVTFNISSLLVLVSIFLLM